MEVKEAKTRIAIAKRPQAGRVFITDVFKLEDELKVASLTAGVL
jgi:hypothetical protein